MMSTGSPLASTTAPYAGIARLFLLITILTAAVGFPASVCAVDDATRQDVRSVVREFIRLWNDGDIDTLLELFTEDGVFITPKGRRAESRRAVRLLLSSERDRLFIGTTLTGAVQSIERLDDDLLRVTGRYRLNGYKMMGFIPVTPRGKFFLTLVQREGQWMIRRAKLVRATAY